jgi:uncharacterized protein (TIGR02118 family)
MPYHQISVIYKAPNLSFEQFKEHYETKHVPLVMSLTDPNFAPLSYIRKYVQRTASETATAAAPHFDAITELVFDTQEIYENWARKLTAGDAGFLIAEDTAKFLDQKRCKICTVEVFS